MSWQFYALTGAFFASLTAILAKIGVRDVDSNLATAIRTVVILIAAWAVVLAQAAQAGKAPVWPNGRSMTFLVLSGLATGASWLFYFRALAMAPASRVAPVDKLSLALTVVLAALVLHEPLSWRLASGVALMLAGAILLIR